MINFGDRLSLATLYTPPEEVNTAAPPPAEPTQICEEIINHVCTKVTLITSKSSSKSLLCTQVLPPSQPWQHPLHTGCCQWEGHRRQHSSPSNQISQPPLRLSLCNLHSPIWQILQNLPILLNILSSNLKLHLTLSCAQHPPTERQGRWWRRRWSPCTAPPPSCRAHQDQQWQGQPSERFINYKHQCIHQQLISVLVSTLWSNHVSEFVD